MSHLTVAASEEAVIELFEAVRGGFTFSSSNSGNFGPFTASYSAAAHLEDGSVDLRDDNTVSIRELDIKWDTLQACLGLNIPEICVGGFCIIPIPFDGCAVRAPEICVFSANPDINFCFDLSGILTSEISVTARPVVKYRVDPARTPAESDLDAEDADHPNMWQVFIDPVTVDIDVFDIADIVGDLLETAITNAINALLGPFPEWVKDLVRAILGPIDDLIRGILDLPDDIGEWFSDLLGTSLGLSNTLVNFVADYFANRNPLVPLEDPYPILDPAPNPNDQNVSLIPVKIPIRDLAVQVNANEMVLEANVGV